MKGAELLNAKDLPTPKDPLDEFTMVEKVSTERFVREAGTDSASQISGSAVYFGRGCSKCGTRVSTRSSCTAQGNLTASAKTTHQRLELLCREDPSLGRKVWLPYQATGRASSRGKQERSGREDVA